jgi:hypothetical protein
MWRSYWLDGCSVDIRTKIGGAVSFNRFCTNRLSISRHFFIAKVSFQVSGYTSRFDGSFFGSTVCVDGARDPLDAWKSYNDEELDIRTCDVYAGLLGAAWDAYFENSTFGSTRRLAAGFERLRNAYIFSLPRAPKSESEFFRSDAYKRAYFGQRALVDALSSLAKLDERLPFVGRPCENHEEQFESQSIYDCLAQAIFEHVVALSWRQHNWNAGRQLLSSLWFRVAPLGGPPNLAILKIQDRLALLLRNRLCENFADGYVLITRALLTVVDVRARMSGHVDQFFSEELRNTMRTKFVERVGKDPKAASYFLPDYYSFEIDTCAIVTNSKWGLQRHGRQIINLA